MVHMYANAEYLGMQLHMYVLVLDGIDFRVLPRPSSVVVIWFAQFLKTAVVYLCRIWAN